MEAASWEQEVHGDTVFPEFEVEVDRRPHHTVAHTFCPSGTTPMWVADMELPTCPEVHQAIIARASHPTFGYTIQPPEIWQAVSRWLETESDQRWHVEPDHFIFAGNLVTATALILQTFTKEQEGVAMCLPLYNPLQEVVTGIGRRFVPIELADPADMSSAEDPTALIPPFQLNLPALETALSDPSVTALIWCSPHNPGGRVWTPEELRSVARLCQTHNIFVISDEIHADLPLFDHKHTPMARICAELDPPYTRVATTGSPSKSFNLAGLHGSYVILADPALRASYLALAAPAYLHFGSTFATAGMLAAYTATGAGWLRRLRCFLSSNVLCVERALAHYCPQGEIRPMRPQASFMVWLECSGLLRLLQDKAVAEGVHVWLQRAAGVFLSDGKVFGPASARYQRINIACPRRQLKAALRRIGEAVQALRDGEPVSGAGDSPG